MCFIGTGRVDCFTSSDEWYATCFWTKNPHCLGIILLFRNSALFNICQVWMSGWSIQWSSSWPTYARSLWILWIELNIAKSYRARQFLSVTDKHVISYLLSIYTKGKNSQYWDQTLQSNAANDASHHCLYLAKIDRMQNMTSDDWELPGSV